MYSVTRSFGLNGLSGFAVAVEADISGGLPAFSIVGLPDSAVRESADRVRAAIKNLGFKFPDRRITINLAPADVRKTGPVYDLPLLLAVLTASGQLEDVPADAAFLGELALDGTLRPVSGVLPMALAAAENGIHALYVPAENAAEAAEACADSMAVYPAHTAREVVDVFFVAVVGNTETHQNAACDAGREAGAHRADHISLKDNAAALEFEVCAAGIFEFFCKILFKPQGTDGVKRQWFCHNNTFRLTAALAVPVNNIFKTCKALKPHGAAGMKFSGADSDFGAKPVNVAVRKARGAVHHDAAGIDFPQKTFCGHVVCGDDRIGVV